MSRFNLLDEKWIPVRLLNGTRDEVGICDTLLRSKEIAAIEDPSPLVVAALHRFLLAVLYRALEGPTDIDQAKALFKSGLPGEKITAYLEKWRDRFWLFDEKYPFYQVLAYEPQEKNGKKEWKSWPAIAAEHNASNAKVLFDHIEIAAAGSIPSRMAARWLIACQTFVLGGGNSDFVYTKSAPSATAAMFLPLGVHLHDTLLLSLVTEIKEVLAGDQPIWEQEPVPLAFLKNGIARSVMGVADLYIWLARSIKFHLDGNGETLSELAFASGKGGQHGFSLPQLTSFSPSASPRERIDVRISQEQMLRGKQHTGNDIRVYSVLYDGVLMVTEPDKFKDGLQRGIGHGKVMGLGLLSVAPIT